MNGVIVYDVEIPKEVDSVKGRWKNPEGLGFGSAVAYDYDLDLYHFFLHESNKKKLINLLNECSCAVTFNGIKFDSKVILGNNTACSDDGMTYISNISFNNFDILAEYIKSRFNCKNIKEAVNMLKNRKIFDGSFSLDLIVANTLGLRKTGKGSHAPVLYKNKRYGELLSYNLNDVRLTRKLFEFIVDYGYVIDGKGRIIPINSNWIRSLR